MFLEKKSWLKGYVSIKVIGEYPEKFFELCAKNGIQSWDINKINRTTCTGIVNVKDIPKLRKVKRKTIHKVYFRDKNGFPFFMKHTLYQKPLLIGFMIAVCFIFFLSNMVWRIDINGLDNELDKKVMEHLTEYGVTKGSLQWNIASPAEIQKKLLEDIPELLWIGVTKRGSNFHLEGVEKTLVEKPEEEEPGHLVAAKEGVIVDLYVENGQPLVKPNDVVNKNDILISAYLGDQKEEDKKEEEQAPKPLVAKGEVIAKVWYRSEIELSIDDKYEVLTGESEKKHYLKVIDWLIPVWNFRYPDYKNSQMEVNERSFYFLKWKLPISYVEQTIFEKEQIEEKRSEDEAKKLALQQAKRRLKKSIPIDAEIIDEKILHERVEHGKVKLTIYYTVLEDIVKRQTINQGD
ncbi:sporulation protein YqfD [Gracilibacillus dipsosauri]|uniref:sporulation protein YqfD n=1 Tax=Gracilibacillus dipsosauri TaxID=178340 RepID=UPI0024094013